MVDVDLVHRYELLRRQLDERLPDWARLRQTRRRNGATQNWSNWSGGCRIVGSGRQPFQVPGGGRPAVGGPCALSESQKYV